MKKRAMTTEKARTVRKKGHDDALEFALSIGLKKDYQNDPKAKKDVIDPSGDSHSVKSGQKKWQIFLYGLNRFEKDESFAVMNGIGDILINCLKAFPISFQEYQKSKNKSKEKLRLYMRELAEKLQKPIRLKAFLNKSIFNGGEVDYLTIKDNELFHIFYNKDILEIMSRNFEVSNSKAISKGQLPEQKVLLKYENLNVGEIEIRKDSEIHYRQIVFSMYKARVMSLLFEKIPLTRKFNKKVLVYGSAGKKFGRW